MRGSSIPNPGAIQKTLENSPFGASDGSKAEEKMPLIINSKSIKNIKEIAIESSPNNAWEGVQALNFNDKNIDSQNVINLIRAIHGEGNKDALYCKTFPLLEEQEDVNDWIANLRKSKDDLGNERNPKLFISAHFTDIPKASKLADEIAKLMDEKEKEDSLTKEKEGALAIALKEFTALTVGFIVTERYNKDAVLFNYVIRNKDFAKKTINHEACPAINMINHTLEQCGEVNAIFWEANDPKKTPFFDKDGNPDFTVDVMDPHRRIEILEEGYGAIAIKFKWVQPPLSPEQEMCDTLFLYSFPTKDGTITAKQKAEALIKFVNKFYETFPIEGEFKSDATSSAPEKFANYCENRSKEIGKIILVEPAELSDANKEIVDSRILPEARKLSYEKLSAKDLIQKLIKIIDSDEDFKDSKKDDKEAILANTLTLLRDELGDTAKAANETVEGLKKIMEDPEKNFYDVPKLDKEAVIKGQENLRRFQANQEATPSTAPKSYRDALMGGERDKGTATRSYSKAVEGSGTSRSPS